MITDKLSKREIEVLQCIADGFERREVADELNIALATVKEHIRHLRDKLGADNTNHAVAMGMRRWLWEWRKR